MSFNAYSSPDFRLPPIALKKDKTSPNDRANMPPSQVTFSVNHVAFSVKMSVESEKTAGKKPKSLPHHLRRQLPEPLPETPGKRPGVVVAHFRGHLRDGIAGAVFYQAAGFVEPHFL